MATLTVNRTYADGEILTESDLDAICDSVETFLNSTKINDDNIQNSGITGSLKLITGSVSTAKLANDAVTEAKLADNAVSEDKIVDAAVTEDKIDDDAVTTDKIEDGAVTYAKLASGLNIPDNVISKTVSDNGYTIQTTENVVKCDSSGGAFSLSLYTAGSGNTGRRLTFTKTTSDFNAVTIDAASTETINGSLTTTLNTQRESVVLESDGTNWVIVSRYIPSVWQSATFTFSSGFGTTTNQSSWIKRVGDSLICRIYANTGTVTAGGATISFPSGISQDDAKGSGTTQQVVGTWWSEDGTNTYGSGNKIGAVAMSSGANNVVLAQGGNGGVAVTAGVSGILANSSGFNVLFTIPVSGWNG